jgi:U3 small nucleolar RNA-associated protein 18
VDPADESDDQDSEASLDENLDDEAELPQPTELKPASSRKAPAWTDPDDTTLKVSLASDKRLRKLRDAPSDDTVGGREYERRLRRQFEKINPTPNWALAARQKIHPAKSKRRRSSNSSGSEVDEDDGLIHDILSSTAGILSTTKKGTLLPKELLAIERLRDANQSAKSEGEIKVVRFHPSPQIPVLLTAGVDRRLRLFNVRSLLVYHLASSHSVILQTDRRSNEPPSPNAPYSLPSPHKCSIPPLRFFHLTHRSPSFLLYPRPSIWYNPPLPAWPLGYHIQQRQPICTRLLNGSVRIQPNRYNPCGRWPEGLRASRRLDLG